MNANELPTPELLRRVIDRLIRDLSERRTPLTELDKPVPLCPPQRVDPVGVQAKREDRGKWGQHHVEDALSDEFSSHGDERGVDRELHVVTGAHAVPTFLAPAAGAQDDASA